MSALPVLISPLLADAPGVRHAFFTRLGGVSEGLYAGLNVGPGSRDDPARVAENRRRAAGHFGAGESALLAAYQVHSAKAVVAKVPWPRARPKADAIVSRTPGLICGALAADCAPVLIADPQARVVAAVHAGWRGALSGVVDSAVAAMRRLGASPERMVAAVGPCIGPRSYEVGLEFAIRFEEAERANARFFTSGASPEKRLFDLPAYVLGRLERAGIGAAEWIGRDTVAEESLFYSNRRAHHRGQSDYGRLLSAITLVDS
jgi:YfiH family protein